MAGGWDVLAKKTTPALNWSKDMGGGGGPKRGSGNGVGVGPFSVQNYWCVYPIILNVWKQVAQTPHRVRGCLLLPEFMTRMAAAPFYELRPRFVGYFSNLVKKSATWYTWPWRYSRQRPTSVGLSARISNKRPIRWLKCHSDQSGMGIWAHTLTLTGDIVPPHPILHMIADASNKTKKRINIRKLPTIPLHAS